MKRPLKTALSILLTALVIIFAAWFPKAMFGGTQNDPSDSKAMDKESPVGIMRAEYLARALSTSERFVYEDYSEVTPEERNAAFKTLNDFLIEAKVPDFLNNEMEQLKDSAVVERLSINTKGGATLPVIHIYLDWQLNWKNWIEIYLDGETGKILYLYASGSCITNVLYDKASQMPSLDLIASIYGEHIGYSLESSQYTTNPNENAFTVIYSDGTDVAEYKINCIYYEGTMYDLKIAPLP